MHKVEKLKPCAAQRQAAPSGPNAVVPHEPLKAADQTNRPRKRKQT